MIVILPSKLITEQNSCDILFQEYYSFTEKMVMYYQRPLPSDNSPYGVNDLKEIHDFNTGKNNSLDIRNNFLFDFNFFLENMVELCFSEILTMLLRLLKKKWLIRVNDIAFLSFFLDHYQLSLSVD